MRGTFFHRGQNFVDLALIIGVVGLVIISMQIYIRRNIQGKVKDLTDYIVSNQQSANSPDATFLESTSNLVTESTLKLEEFKGGGRRLSGNENSTFNYTQGTP